MPIEYRILLGQRLVHSEIVGRVTIEDHVAHFESLSCDPDYVPPMLKIVDFRRCTDYAVDAEGERSIAAAKSGHPEFADERCAIVAPVSWIYGMNRIFVAVSGALSGPVEVFRSLDDALEWLGIDRAEFDAGRRLAEHTEHTT